MKKYPVKTSLFAAAFCAAVPALAQTPPVVFANAYGVPGLIDMPNAEAFPDGELVISGTAAGGLRRVSLSFQLSPRITGSFRYGSIRGFDPTQANTTRFDRSFDLRFKLLKEGRIRPAVTLGLQDFIGSGIYSGEYIVASKNIGSVRATAGVGWGRYGSFGGVRNPLASIAPSFATRSDQATLSVGGLLETGKWFRGPMAAFGGLEWSTPIRGLTAMVEFSSDAYAPETSRGLLNRRSPLNFGLSYQLSQNASVALTYKHGSEIGLSFTSLLNPRRPIRAVSEEAPLPVRIRGQAPYRPGAQLESLARAEGLVIEAKSISGGVAQIRFRNNRYDAAAQALGRMARVASIALPDNIDTFVLMPVERGVPIAQVTLSRADLEAQALAAGGTEELARRISVTDAKGQRGDMTLTQGLYPKFNWAISPYVQVHLFDPDDPLRLDFGIRGSAGVDIAPGLSLSGSVTKRLLGNINQNSRQSDSVLPRVRSDINLYQNQGDPALERLTLDYQFKLAPSVYGRVSAGYLEPMYGGLSAELLWKPATSRFALGAEVNAVRQRAFNQRLGFQTYQTVTGHVSAYYAFKNGFEAQLDVGRYLAKDIGATVSVNRTFDNGWKVGAYATLTNVSFQDFGEGSFDKGIRLSIPFSWVTGRPKRQDYNLLIQPVYRDGGARLDVANRLYNTVRASDKYGIERSWGKVLR